MFRNITKNFLKTLGLLCDLRVNLFLHSRYWYWSFKSCYHVYIHTNQLKVNFYLVTVQLILSSWENAGKHGEKKLTKFFILKNFNWKNVCKTFTLTVTQRAGNHQQRLASQSPSYSNCMRLNQKNFLMNSLILQPEASWQGLQNQPENQ